MQTGRPIGQEEIAAIWRAHGLGPVKTLAMPERGGVNLCFFVNDDMVIRFQMRDFQFAKLRAEKTAYDLLRGSEVPVPEAVALDESKTRVPYPYLIATRLPGTPVIDCWGALDGTTRERLAFEAGRYQAVLHGRHLNAFGALDGLAEGKGFPTWTAYLNDYCERYAGMARDLEALDAEMAARLRRLMARFQPTAAQVTTASLLHSDYHFENILQQNGRITGVIDFEWALAGDPAFDCRIDEHLEETCPGSVRPLYAGYASVRPLPEDHVFKGRVYALLLRLETVAAWRTEPPDAWYLDQRRKLCEELAAREREL